MREPRQLTGWCRPSAPQGDQSSRTRLMSCLSSTAVMRCRCATWSNGRELRPRRVASIVVRPMCSTKKSMKSSSLNSSSLGGSQQGERAHLAQGKTVVGSAGRGETVVGSAGRGEKVSTGVFGTRRSTLTRTFSPDTFGDNHQLVLQVTFFSTLR